MISFLAYTLFGQLCILNRDENRFKIWLRISLGHSGGGGGSRLFIVCLLCQHYMFLSLCSWFRLVLSSGKGSDYILLASPSN